MPDRQKDSIDSTHFSADILVFIRLLQVHQVHYVVVGGEAVIYHGYPRFTEVKCFGCPLHQGNGPNVRLKVRKEMRDALSS